MSGNLDLGLPRGLSGTESANAGDVGQSLSREDPLKKETATRSYILAWENPCAEEPGGLPSLGWQKSGT